MKQSLIILSLILTTFLSSCQTSNNDPTTKPLDDIKKPTKLMDQFSYIVGNSLGENFVRDSVVDLNFELFIAGIRIQLEGKKPLFDKREMDSIMQLMQPIFQARTQAALLKQKMQFEKNKEKSYKFLEENKKQSGVISTPSGLQYKILKQGSGSSPAINDHVQLHVIAKVLDGDEFINTYKHKRTIAVEISENITKSWFEAILKMKIGSKWIVYSPPDLAYGEQGLEKVPGNSVVIYELELIDFQVDPYPEEQAMPKNSQQQPQQ